MADLRSIARQLAVCVDGAVAIETAIIAPVLIVMSVGGFEVSSMVARQSELQSAAAEAAAIVRASPPEDYSDRSTIKNVLRVSTGLGSEDVSVAEIYRCGTSTSYVFTNTCASGEDVSTFIGVFMRDTYTPTWTQWGFGQPITYRVWRTVQIS